MSLAKTLKYALSFFYDKYEGELIFDQEKTEMNVAEVLAMASPIAEKADWLTDRNGTVVAMRERPDLMRLWRTDELVWRVAFDYTRIAGFELGDFRGETLGCVLIDDKTRKFIKCEERTRFHKDSINGSMTELDAIKFARNFAFKENWDWHEPVTAQNFGDVWEIRTDTVFQDAWIYLQFNEKTGKIVSKSYRPRQEIGAKMTREEAWEIAKAIAHKKEWVFFEPVCAGFEDGIWDIHLPPVTDYSASVRIDDSTKKVVEIYFGSGLSGQSLHEVYEKN